jgi:SAM-dependent methyltransferase
MINNQKIVLNIGCGDTRVKEIKPFFSDWIEIRADLYHDDVDVKCDLVSMNEIATESIDCLWASHILEHQYWHEIPQIFSNIRRVLKDDGFVVITVPDIGAIADRIKDSLIDPIPEFNGLSALDIIYGDRNRLRKGGIGELHKIAFTLQTLSMTINEFKLSGFIRQEKYQLTAVCFKKTIQEDILHHL